MLLILLLKYLCWCTADLFLDMLTTTTQTTVIITTATRATRTPMTAPSAELLILVVLPSCEVVVGDTLSVVVMIKVVVGVDTLSINLVVLMSLPLVAAVASDCVTVAAFKTVKLLLYSLFHVIQS